MAGCDMFAPNVDGPRGGADDRDVTGGPGLDEPVILPGRGSQPSVARPAVTNGSPATSASGAFRCPRAGARRKHERTGSDRTIASSIPGAATGGRSSATSLPWSSSPADGWVMSKSAVYFDLGCAPSKAVSSRVLVSFSQPEPSRPTVSRRPPGQRSVRPLRRGPGGERLPGP